MSELVIETSDLRKVYRTRGDREVVASARRHDDSLRRDPGGAEDPDPDHRGGSSQ